MHVSRYKQWEVLPKSKFSGEWFKLAVGNDTLESYIMPLDVTDEQIKEAEKQGYQVIDIPLEMLHRFEMDLNRTLIDTCGIAVQSSYKYITHRIIEPCLGDGINPFKQEIIKTGLKDDIQIKDFFTPEVVPEILYTKKIYVHCDLSKSGDMTGISGVAVLGYKNQERFNDEGAVSTIKEMVFRHVFSVGLKCPPNDELSMIKVKDFIHYLKYELGWNIAGVSCDGYQSLMLLQSLKLDGFEAKEVSMDIVDTKKKECVGYTSFRNTILEKRINLLNLYELQRELTALEKNESTGKVDHPKQSVKMINGEMVKSVGKDIADSLGGAVYNAVLSVNLDELDYLDQKILTNDLLGNTYIRNMSNVNALNRKFGFTVDSNGIVHLEDNNKTLNIEKDEDINAMISAEMKKLKDSANNPEEQKPEKKLEKYFGKRDGMIII